MNMPMGPLPFGVPGDNQRAENRLEVIAAEQRILTYADALLSFMRKLDWDSDPRLCAEMDKFFTHQPGGKNPGWGPSEGAPGDPIPPGKIWILDRFDADSNRLLLELLRAAWERRNWRAAYGEHHELERT